MATGAWQLSRHFVLVLSSDPEFVERMHASLAEADMESGTTGMVEHAREQCQTGSVACLMLDADLEHGTAFELLRERGHAAWLESTAVVVVAANDVDVNAVVSLELGADDFVSKTANSRELAIRVERAIARRGRTSRPQTSVWRSLVVDRVAMRVTVGGVQAALSRAEFRLLEQMLANPSRLWRRLDLAVLLRGSESEASERAVDKVIARLRVKLGSARGVVETVRGFGYRIARP